MSNLAVTNEFLDLAFAQAVIAERSLKGLDYATSAAYPIWDRMAIESLLIHAEMTIEDIKLSKADIIASDPWPAKRYGDFLIHFARHFVW